MQYVLTFLLDEGKTNVGYYLLQIGSLVQPLKNTSTALSSFDVSFGVLWSNRFVPKPQICKLNCEKLLW